MLPLKNLAYQGLIVSYDLHLMIDGCFIFSLPAYVNFVMIQVSAFLSSVFVEYGIMYYNVAWFFITFHFYPLSCAIFSNPYPCQWSLPAYHNGDGILMVMDGQGLTWLKAPHLPWDGLGE